MDNLINSYINNKFNININNEEIIIKHLDYDDSINFKNNGDIHMRECVLMEFHELSDKRLKENIMLLPERTRNRLVLENCEMSYTVEDLLDISEELQVPIVIDFHHDDIYPSSQSVEFYYERVFKVWFDRGIKPKVHVSNSVPGVKETDTKTLRRKHSDYIQFLHKSLYLIKFPIDIMLECKMKEKALLRLKSVTLKEYFSR
jgi:UV DNA damage repair endonuclease